MNSRLVLVGVAAVLLAAMVLAATVLGGGEPDTPHDDPCLRAWNSDPVAIQDGLHAYEVHGYRDSLLTRVDENARMIGLDAEGGRCALVFASPKPDQEPDFGVRVYDDGRWAGLGLVDGLSIARIERMQREAIDLANANLLADGSLELKLR